MSISVKLPGVAVLTAAAMAFSRGLMSFQRALLNTRIAICRPMRFC
jgi:hypothetical protein